MEVRENIHDWDNEEVWVKGWLGTCEGYDCGIYMSLEDAKLVAEGDADSDEWSAAMDRRLSVGYTALFDPVAKDLQFQEVVIRAIAIDDCFKPRVMCLDRASELVPLEIKRAS